jgi:chromosome segregation ATPase
MSDYAKLKELAGIMIRYQEGDLSGTEARNFHQHLADYEVMTQPADVLALIAENERLTGFVVHRRAQADQYDEALTKIADQRDQLKAEIAGLKTGYEAYEQVNAQLKAEVEALRKEREGKVLCELELFETLRDAANTEADEHRQCLATYRPLRQASLDSVVRKCDDLLAAMSKGVQS